MKLIHAFPRPEIPVTVIPPGDVGFRADRADVLGRGLQVLKLILSHGLLCTPEKFKLYSNYRTTDATKARLAATGQYYDQIVQSRACFTLSNQWDLSREYTIQNAQNVRDVTHSELFGEFSIGIDPLRAKNFGVHPTVYYYRHDLGRTGPTTPGNKLAGLGSQIVERLDELRSLLTVLSHVEGRSEMASDPNLRLPNSQLLEEMGLRISHEDEIAKEIRGLSTKNASFLLKYFNTDRVPAWNLVDFVTMLLSLYQTTDSTRENAPLAFFQQREWRLIHHMMSGLDWIALGTQPLHRDPSAAHLVPARDEIRAYIEPLLMRKGSEYCRWFIDHSWIFTGTSGVPFRNYIDEIVVPRECLEDAKLIVKGMSFLAKVPEVMPSAARWRIDYEGGVPKVVFPS